MKLGLGLGEGVEVSLFTVNSRHARHVCFVSIIAECLFTMTLSLNLYVHL